MAAGPRLPRSQPRLARLGVSSLTVYLTVRYDETVRARARSPAVVSCAASQVHTPQAPQLATAAESPLWEFAPCGRSLTVHPVPSHVRAQAAPQRSLEHHHD